MCDWLCTATVMTINISVCYYLLFMCVRVLHTNDLMNLPSRTALFTLFPFLIRFGTALLLCYVWRCNAARPATVVDDNKKRKKKKRDFWVDFGANKLQWATRQNANKTIKQFIKCRVSVSSEDIIRDCFFFLLQFILWLLNVYSIFKLNKYIIFYGAVIDTWYTYAMKKCGTQIDDSSTNRARHLNLHDEDERRYWPCWM